RTEREMPAERPAQEDESDGTRPPTCQGPHVLGERVARCSSPDRHRLEYHAEREPGDPPATVAPVEGAAASALLVYRYAHPCCSSNASSIQTTSRACGGSSRALY